jgi:hypothetical protein
MVAHAYNPSYLGGRDREDQGSRPTLAKSLQDPISANSGDIVLVILATSYTGSTNRMLVVHVSLGINVRPYSKNNKSEKGWGIGSSSTEPA